MTTMLAALAQKGACSMQLEQVPIPTLQEDEVLIKVAAAGIAPGMINLMKQGRFKYFPTIPGHEIAGIVTQAGGSENTGWIGKRVRVHPMLSCGHCDLCRSERQHMCGEAAIIGHGAFGRGTLERYRRYHDGGLAEYVCVPVDLLDPLPAHVSFDVGAKVHDLANAVRVLTCAALAPTGRLIITAATGTMGTSCLILAKHYGAREVILVGRSRQRLEQVRTLEADLPVHLVALDELPADWEESGGLTQALREQWPQGADGVLDFFSSGAGSAQSMAALAQGGGFAHMGANDAVLPFPLREIMVRGWRVIGTKACTRADTNAVLALLNEKRIDVEPLITHRFALRDVNRAVSLMLSRSEPMWMTTVNP